jgi:ribosomal protein S14
MIFSKIKDKNLRKSVLKTEHKNKIKKFILINFLNSNKNRKKFNINANVFNNKIKPKYLIKNKTKLTSRCIITNKSRVVNKNINISRSTLRDMLQFGLIPGYKKAVW